MTLIIVTPATPVHPSVHGKFCLELRIYWPLSEPQKPLQLRVGAELSLKPSFVSKTEVPETLMIVASAVPMKTNQNSALLLASSLVGVPCT
jgi:hypothetical protein